MALIALPVRLVPSAKGLTKYAALSEAAHTVQQFVRLMLTRAVTCAAANSSGPVVEAPPGAVARFCETVAAAGRGEGPSFSHNRHCLFVSRARTNRAASDILQLIRPPLQCLLRQPLAVAK